MTVNQFFGHPFSIFAVAGAVMFPGGWLDAQFFGCSAILFAASSISLVILPLPSDGR